MAPWFEPGLSRLVPREDPLGAPLLALGFYDEIVALDLQERKTIPIVCVDTRGTNGPRRSALGYDNGMQRLSQLEQRVRCAMNAPISLKGMQKKPRKPQLAIVPNRAGFLRTVEKAKKAIERGDIYQANLSLRFSGPFQGDPWDLHRRLRLLNPSPYACRLWFPRFSILSTSPELLLRIRGDRVVTRPIAGTRPRGASPLEDRRMEGALLLNSKEKAEHIMLVDLERNDLGRVCIPGSVQVSERMVVERYSHVMHIVSQVEGQLTRGRHPFEAMGTVFPGGTISGCPKIRAIQLIRELEPLARGPFFGSAGWFGHSGDLDLNILIRTLVFKDGQVHIQAGAGIVADSDPEREYVESLQKAKILLEILGTHPNPLHKSLLQDPLHSV
jgi:para-aminobenzoate synthetase component 1